MIDGVVPFPPDVAAHYRAMGYWRGDTLASLLRAWACDPARVALVTPDRTYTYAELDATADRIAAGLADAGIVRGDRVVVQLPNTASFLTVSVAMFRAGVLPVYALPKHGRHEVAYLVSCSEATGYVVPEVHDGRDFLDLARDVVARMPSLQVLVDGDAGASGFMSLAAIESDPVPLDAPDPAAPAFFLLSGGTTGTPKLIPRTHDDYSYQLRATAAALEVDEGAVYLAALPVAHNAALGCPGLLGTLLVGGKVALAASPSPDDVFPLVAAAGVTATTVMPPIAQLWVELAPSWGVDFARVVLQVGGAPLSPHLASRLASELGCRLTHWFGMAEGLLTHTRLGDPDDVVFSTVGRPLSPGDELRVVGHDGVDVEPGEEGELWVRGPYTLRGYYRAPEHNQVAFSPDGYLRTGDLVRITTAGNMVVTGRVKDVIIRCGEKVSAAELEDMLLQHALVQEVAVVGVEDGELGERVCACVVPRHEPPSLPDVRQFLAGRGLAEFKLPDCLEIVDGLPRTGVGKVDKARLRGQLINGSPAAASAGGA